MKYDSLKLKFATPKALIAEARRLVSDSDALGAESLISAIGGHEDPGSSCHIYTHYKHLKGLAHEVAKATPGYTDNFDGVTRLRRLTWRERLTGRASV